MNPYANIPFPGQAISPNQPQEARLASGAIWTVPNGNYMVKLGAQSAAQFFDYYSGLWRTFETGQTSHPIFIPSDGVNYRVVNLSGSIIGANITTAGTAYTQVGTAVSFAAPAAGTPSVTATATPIIGGSLSFAITAQGSGYTNPLIIVPPPQTLGGTPGLCIPASLLSTTVTAGAIAAVTAGFAGAGYLVAPSANTVTTTPAQFAANPNFWLNSQNIVIIDPAGTGAIITPSITNGTPTSGGLTGLIMNNNGAGYDGTHIPAVTITCAGSSGTAAATALPSMALKSVTVGGTNTGYSASAVGITSLTSGAAAPLATIFGDPVLVRAARFIADGSGGVLGTPVVEDAGSGFQTVPLAKQVGNATADGSVNATFTAVVGGVNNTLIFWQVG